MPYAVQQSTTAFPLVFLMVQSSDHITGLTGASPTVTLSKSGAAFASPSGAVTEIANGWYKVAGNATDSNTLGPLILHATAASGDPTDMVFEVVAYNPQDGVHLGLTSLPNTAVTTNASLITSGSGTDQLTVSGGIASADVKKWNGTTVATPATAGIPDINVKNINNVAAATPGASGGILISGSNSGTTTLGALTVTGATTMTGGLAIAAGATITGSATGAGLTISGGGTSGAGLVINTTSGDGVQVSPTAGHGVNIAANGTSKHGITSTGGTAGTSDGIKGVAGTGGVDIRGNITGNVTGNLSGSVGSVTATVTANTTQIAGAAVSTSTAQIGVNVVNIAGSASTGAAGFVGIDWSQVHAPTTTLDLSGTTIKNLDGNTVQTGDAFARLGAPAGASVSADIAEIEGETDTLLAGVIVTTNNDKTGYSLSQSFPANFASLAITGGGAVTVGTNTDKTGYSISGNVTVGGYAAGQDPMTLAFQTALTESYAALHAAPTATQLLFALRGHMGEKSVTGTTLTLKRVDGATTAETYSLNDAVSPTSITRAS